MGLNIILVGLGRQGREHLFPCIELRNKGYIDNIYVYDINFDAIREISNKLGLIQLKSLDSLSDLDIKLSIITVPNIHHFEISKIMIENHVNILIEKPMYLSMDEYKKIELSIKKKNLLLFSCQQRVYNGFYRTIDENVRKLGNIKVVRYTFTLNDKNKSWYYEKKQGGGVLMGLSRHCLYFFNYFFSQNKKIYGSILSGKNRIFEYDSDDVNILNLKYDNGMEGFIYTSSVAFLKQENIEIIGENGIFYIDREKNFLNLFGSESIYNNDLSSGYEEQIKHFISLINNKNIIDNVGIRTLYDTLYIKNI